jgi:hypothetical protein
MSSLYPDGPATPNRAWFIARGLIKPAPARVFFCRETGMFTEPGGPSWLWRESMAPTLRLLPGEREKFEAQAKEALRTGRVLAVIHRNEPEAA